MAYIFGDGFSLYATVNDPYAGYWDSGSGAQSQFVAGRFAGSQAISFFNNPLAAAFVKSSSVNDAVHHIVCAFRQITALTGTVLATFFQLSDAATNQVCIVFRQDGAILLTSATPAGTVLATYTGAVTATNTWFAFEFEVVINNTTGRFRVRKNGNTVDDFDSGATLNTRPGTNAYANKLIIGTNSGTPPTQQIGDFLWRSDAASVPWVGDVRCYTRMPSTTASAQFAVSPNPVTLVTASASSVSDPTATSRYTTFTAPFSGTVGTIVVQVNTGFAGNMKCSVFADISNNPGAVLGSATSLVNPVTGANTFTFGTPVTVTKGTTYWFGVSHDVTALLTTGSIGPGRISNSVSYAAFPTGTPGVNTGQASASGTVNITPTNAAEYVNETLQDGTTSYVYDSVVGHADFYNIAAMSGTPSPVVAVTTRGFVEKGDAGTRSGAVQLKSGSTVVTTTWNPADLSNVTLSGGSLVVASTASGGVRTVFSTTSGKYYFEYTVNTWGGAFAQAIGLGNASAVLTSAANTPTNAVVIYRNGSIYVNNVGQSAIINGGSSMSDGAVVSIAFDLGAKLFWVRRIGDVNGWNGNPANDPATGVGGISLSSITSTALFGLAAFNAASMQVTANFGATTFVGVVPAGFASGFGLAGTTVQSTSTPLGSSFGWLWRTDTTDPNTSAAWTAANVNAVQIGPVVTA